eukprot:751956-Hanusia_phi.AAC.1
MVRTGRTVFMRTLRDPRQEEGERAVSWFCAVQVLTCRPCACHAVQLLQVTAAGLRCCATATGGYRRGWR